MQYKKINKAESLPIVPQPHKQAFAQFCWQKKPENIARIVIFIPFFHVSITIDIASVCHQITQNTNFIQTEGREGQEGRLAGSSSNEH